MGCIRDIKRLVDSYSTCSQAFEYHCIGSVFQHTDTSGRDGYQCINNASIKLVDYSVDPGVTGVSYGTRNCDRNDAVERMDTGTLPQSVLPVTRWLPGDIDGAGEGGTLVLKELKCTNTPTLKLNCAGLGVGVQWVRCVSRVMAWAACRSGPIASPLGGTRVWAVQEYTSAAKTATPSTSTTQTSVSAVL